MPKFLKFKFQFFVHFGLFVSFVWLLFCLFFIYFSLLNVLLVLLVALGLFGFFFWLVLLNLFLDTWCFTCLLLYLLVFFRFYVCWLSYWVVCEYLFLVIDYAFQLFKEYFRFFCFILKFEIFEVWIYRNLFICF